MTKSQQDWLRIIVPGMMIFVGFATLVFPKEPFDTWAKVKIGDWAAPTVAAIIIGVIYYAYDPRGPFLREFVFNVTDRKILDAVNSCAFEGSHKLKPTVDGERTARRVFFKFVDSDESLKAKGGSIFLNGTLASSCLDGAFIFGIIGAYHILLLPHGSSLYHFGWACGMLLFATFLFRILLPKLGAKHADLVDDQTSHLVEHYRDAIGKHLAERAAKPPEGDER